MLKFFIVSLTYKNPHDLKRIEEVFPRHIEYIEALHAQGRYLLSGRREPRVGGVLTAGNCSLAEIQAMVAKDPYHKEDVADFEIIDFIPTRALDQRLMDFHPRV